MFEGKTITLTDTVIVEVPEFLDRVQYDTLIEMVQVDPITLKEYIVRYEIRNDTILIDCGDQEIITVTNTVTNTITIKPTFWQRLQWFVYVAAILLVFFGIKKIL